MVRPYIEPGKIDSTHVPAYPSSPIQVLGTVEDGSAESEILSPAALNFLATLHRAFNPTRLALLRHRSFLQSRWDKGDLPDFLEETRHIREDPTWRGAHPAPGLVDRRVEITGPVDRKMVVNALNSGATQFMADFEGQFLL